MMSPIASFLTEFQPFGALPRPPAWGDSQTGGGPDPLADEDVHRQALEAAHRAGVLEADDRAAAILATRDAAWRAEQEAAIAAARQHWAETEGAALADRFGESLLAFEDRLAHAVAAALEPLIAGAVVARAATGLREAIESLLTSGEHRPILVTGSADLVEALRLSFAGRAELTCVPDATPDVTIQVGDTAIRSTIATWAEHMACEIKGER